MALALSRKKGESIVLIDDSGNVEDIIITVSEKSDFARGGVRLIITAPAYIRIKRSELLLKEGK
jgi:sRNA-binding carbon storage regulator CsrA